MYVCMYVCMYVYMYVCMYLSVCMHTCVFSYPGAGRAAQVAAAGDRHGHRLPEAVLLAQLAALRRPPSAGAHLRLPRLQGRGVRRHLQQQTHQHLPDRRWVTGRRVTLTPARPSVGHGVEGHINTCQTVGGSRGGGSHQHLPDCRWVTGRRVTLTPARPSVGHRVEGHTNTCQTVGGSRVEGHTTVRGHSLTNYKAGIV